jgi:phosphoribosylanthranilate isomerase
MSHRTRIKICGLTREDDVAAAVGAGADAVGFVLYPHSPRHVTADRAARLAALLPPFVTPVVLFVNAPRDVVAAVLAALPSALPQFHGDESAADCRACGRPFLRAARMAPGFPLLDFAASQVGAAGLVLDAFVDGYGGGGKTFDWSLIPSDVPLPVVLSGGLNAANVAEAIARVRPWAVDVSSGVERSPGLKDADAIRRFCAAVRRADDSAAAVQPS